MLKKKLFSRKHPRTLCSLCLTGQRQDVPTFDFEALTAGLAASGVSAVPRDPRQRGIKFLTPLLPLGFHQAIVEIWLPVE